MGVLLAEPLLLRLAAPSRTSCSGQFKAQCGVVAAPVIVRFAAPALLSVLSPTMEKLSPKLQLNSWQPRLSLLAALVLGIAGATVPAANGNAWCMADAPPAAATEDGYVVADAVRKKYGRYPPWCRMNVDQVPLPFVNDMDLTYDMTGSTRVVINQLGPALSKRQATGQVCFRPCLPPISGCTGPQAEQRYKQYLQAQPAPCIIFRGKGNITDLERNAYPEGLVVLWQDKAWVDTGPSPWSGQRM